MYGRGWACTAVANTNRPAKDDIAGESFLMSRSSVLLAQSR
jgi:hypothetical protein